MSGEESGSMPQAPAPAQADILQGLVKKALGPVVISLMLGGGAVGGGAYFGGAGVLQALDSKVESNGIILNRLEGRAQRDDERWKAFNDLRDLYRDLEERVRGLERFHPDRP